MYTAKINSNCWVSVLTFGGAQTFKIDQSGYGREMTFDRRVVESQIWTIFTSGLNFYVFPTAEITVTYRPRDHLTK